MKSIKERYTEILVDRIADSEEEFKTLMKKLMLIHHKERQSTVHHDVLDTLIHQYWKAFLANCRNPRIGVTKALNIAFNIK